MKTQRTILLLLIMAATTIIGCNREIAADRADSIITCQDTQLMKDGEPYSYIGTNMWYASILGSTGEEGDRERLCKELDRLKEIGITNLRILSGPDAGSSLANPAKPYLQTAPGVFNDTILEGLDFVIAELEKRDMDAVIYLNLSLIHI